MLSSCSYKYFQPDRYIDDGTNIEYAGTPEGILTVLSVPNPGAVLIIK